MYYDELKQTIIKKLNDKLDIQVLDNLENLDTVAKTEYPKMLFVEYLDIDKKIIRVIDYITYDTKGVEVAPNLQNIVGLYIHSSVNKSLIKSYDNGVMVLEDSQLGSQMNEYIDELIIESDNNETVKPKDYVYISSLHNMNKRLNKSVVELFRRFEVGVYCYDDTNENKANEYMKAIYECLDEDLQIVDEQGNITKYMANIYSPLKFEVTENGKSDRVIYGSIMYRTYK